MFENDQKRLKTAEKSVLTSFQVPAAPESWLKYTTVWYRGYADSNFFKNGGMQKVLQLFRGYTDEKD